MRRLALSLLLILPAAFAGGEELSGRALLTYEQYDNDATATNGFRQSYDFGFGSALTTTSLVRLFFHADDFQARTEIGEGDTRQSGTRVLQPTGELMLNNETLRILVRSDYYDTRFHSEGLETSRTLERNLAQLNWRVASRIDFSIDAQRNATHDGAAATRDVNELARASLDYGWRGLQLNATERYSHTIEDDFDRTVLGHEAALQYSTTQLGGRLSINANASASFNDNEEKLVGGGSANVPIPVSIGRALYTVDDTPSDDRDHPFSPYPGLNDGNLETSTGLSLGPTSVSFQNLALDIGRIERLDEIRIVVRDRNGNPLRNGGGPVTWDVYVSEDGLTWTPITDAQTTFDRSLSRYEVAFTQTFSRWFKVVNFGVNADETFITEVQGVYHTTVDARDPLNGSDRFYTGMASIVAKPVRRLTLSYNGAYNASSREYRRAAASDSTYVDHLGAVELALLRSLAVRGEYSTREATTSLDSRFADTANTTTLLLLYRPTSQLRITGELGRLNQTLGEMEFAIDTRAVHIDAAILKSLSILLNVGTQTQTLSADQSRSVRHYLDLTGQARLTRSLRLLLLASVQRVDTTSQDSAVQLLGVPRDNRASAEFIWRPGRPLTLSTRVGYVSGMELSGFTHRVRGEWYPFEDGALVLGGSYDRDIDPITDRRATRMVFNPRWLINQWAAFDLNYTSVSLAFASSTTRQRSLFATLTLTR